MPHAAEFSDTDPIAMDVWLGLLRAKSPGERIATAFDLTDFALRIAESGVRANHPGASDREIFLRAAALRLPRHLMIVAYGWDPQQHSVAPVQTEASQAQASQPTASPISDAPPR